MGGIAEARDKPAMSIEVLDTHLDYLRRDITTVLAAIQHMATKEDIRALEARMQLFVTRQDFDALASKVAAGSVQSTLDRWLTTATKIATFFGVVGAGCGAVYAFVHFVDRVPK